MRLDKIAEAVKQEQKPSGKFSILLYGDPKTGKTRLAATIAKVSWVRNVYFFDIENGSETLVTMVREGVLTAIEASKIIIYKIPDTKQLPMACETMLKVFTVPKLLTICDLHGRISCVACAEKDVKGNITKLQGQEFDMSALTEEDVIIVDSGSALGDSILNYHMNANGNPKKPGWDEYGPQGIDLTNIGLVIQSGKANVIMLTHTLAVEVIENDVKRDVIFPLVGTKNMSKKYGKYFGHVVYLHKKMNIHKAGSGSTYQPDVITGSRSGWQIEKEGVPSFDKLFEKLAISR